MPLSTSNSDKRYLIAAALTFVVLVGTWEVILRANAGATVEFELKRPKLSMTDEGGERWVVFGNCLVMTGISPKLLDEQLERRKRVIVNIASHEQSPIGFFSYLRRSQQYPDVVILNVSSWINGTNFEQESELVMRVDPLGFGAHTVTAKKRGGQQAYRDDADLGTGKFQTEVEAAIAGTLAANVQTIAHRYHLFDYLMFIATLATTAKLDNALYQLQIQSWFKVHTSETDGLGYLGVHVNYRDDWPAGVDVMAERYLKRMRFSRLLTPQYWSLLEDEVRAFQAHGTKVKIVRMPEHPRIREFNNDTYAISQRLRELTERTGAATLDLSELGPAEGVRLFDAVHPDAAAAEVITRKISDWLRAQP